MAVKLLGDLSASGNATFNSEVNLPSGGKVDWANGDARIEEGLVTNYSLSFQTYTGSALTTKMFIQSGGNVGIGTTSPTGVLHVDGTHGRWKVNGYGGMYFNNNSDTNNTRYIHARSDGALSIGRGLTASLTGTAPDEYFATSFDQLYIKSDGKVGINTTSPAHFLDVNGNISGSVIYSKLLEINPASTGNGMSLSQNVEGFQYDAEESNADAARYWLRFDYTNGSSYPYLTNRTPSGDVAIFTGVAAGGNENEHFRIKGGDGTVDAYFTNANVGIGTTSPAQKLHINDGGIRVEKFATGLGGFISVGNGTEVAGNYSAYFFGNTNQDAAYFKGGIAYETLSSTNGRGDMHFLQNSSANGTNASINDSVMTILNGGNVGMGTTAPIAKLDVQSTSTSANPVIQIVNTSSSTFNHSINALAPNLTTGENNIFIIGRAASAKNSGYIGYKYSSAGSNLNVLTFGHWASDNLMNLTGDGKLGIGTASPGYKLSVDDNSVTNIPKTLLQFDASSIADNGGYNIDFRASSNDAADRYVARIRGIRESTGALSQLSFWTESGSALLQRMTIRASGNVGIGTTSPSTKLDVNGVITATSGNSTNWNTAYGWGDHSTEGYLTSETFSSSDVVMSLSGNDVTAGESITLAGGLSYSGTTLTSANDNTTYTAGTGLTLTGTSFSVTANTYAPLASPALTGTPTAPTAAAATNTTQLATTAFVSTAIANLSDSAPATLDTLNELAAALGDDANFSTTVTNSIATKLPLAGGTLTGDLTISQTDATSPGYLIHLHNASNTNGATIKFSDTSTQDSQYGNITFYHQDGKSYGSGASFILGSSEANTTILADGKLMYAEGIYSKPSSGTGAGTRKDANWDTAYSWGDHASASYLTAETFGSSDVVLSLSGNDVTAGESITLAGGLSYSGTTLTSANDNTTYTAGTGLTLTNTTFSVTANTYATAAQGTTADAALPKAGGTMTGNLTINGSTSGTSAANRAFDIPKTGLGAVHITGAQGGTTGSADTVPLITFPGSSSISTQVQGGIYLSQNSSTGTSLGFSTTDSYSNGPKMSLTIFDNGDVTVSRGKLFLNSVATTTGSEALILVSGEVKSRTLGSNAFNSTAYLEDITPATPSVDSATVVGETIEVVFSQSSTPDVDYYQVWSAVGSSGSYGMIAHIPQEDVASSMTVIDATFNVSDTMYYRVYAVKSGIYSTAGTINKAFSAAALDVANMSVVNLNTAYYIQYEMPDSRFVDHVEIYMDAEATASNLTRTGATLVYSGNNTSYMYKIGANDLDKFHQFWVEVIES